MADTTLADLAKSLGIDTTSIPVGGAEAKKTGTYTSVQTSATIPDDLALQQKVNQVFKEFYGRDANQNELAIWLPQLKSKYKGPDGKSKTTVKSVYDKNGNLVRTDYLTADNLDPKLWLTDKIKTQLVSGKQEVNKAAIPEGPSGKYFTEIKNLAARNGIMLSDEAATEYANKIVAGVLDADTAFNTIRESAASAFPQLADKIKAGIDLKTLADPYIQSMSNILEVPYSAVDLFDPKIRSALSFTLPDGKIGTKSIYDFEKELRQDPRWQYTNNAKKTVADSTLRVLQDFGFQG
jgi:uncharacterized protein YxeA